MTTSMHAANNTDSPSTSALRTIVAEILSVHGDAERARAVAGVRRVAERWLAADGDTDELKRFCVEHYVPASGQVALVDRLESAVTWIGGHLYELRRHLRRFTDLRVNRVGAIDDVLATFDPAPDLPDQWYRQKIAFVALLNCDRPTLDSMLADGENWSVDRWVESRVAQSFPPRVPKELNDRVRDVAHRANRFVSEFHVPVGTLIDANNKRRFEPDRKLVAHWLIREAMKAGYADADGLPMQRALAWTMARHIDGTIPRSVMEGKGDEDWNPERNTIAGKPKGDTVGLVRYEHLLAWRDVNFALDPYFPEHGTAIRRKCELEREIPEDDVERILVDLLSSDARRPLAAFLRKRVGRALEPFDIYCDEFVQPLPIDDLNRRVRERFGDTKGMERNLPQLLEELGFAHDDATFYGQRIKVEIARGAGHAVRPGVPELNAWLRTSSLDNELGWDGFDTAMHELGHTIEQTISTHFVPRTALRGVPNTACTEAFAFLFQSLGRKALGLLTSDEEHRAFELDAVQTFAAACQIAGPALLELRVWNWIYQHPNANAASLCAEVLRVADELWRDYYEIDFGPDPYHLLAAYQHMIAHPLYLPDYPIGHVISHQIRSHMRGKDLASETKRICSIGRVTPQLWMQRAVGGGIDVAPLARDAEAALRQMT